MVYRIDAETDRTCIEEFRAAPIAPHSPGLQRVLNIMRLWRGGDQFILIAREEFADYVIDRRVELVRHGGFIGDMAGVRVQKKHPAFVADR